MTELSNGLQTLPLLGSPQSVLLWLIVLALGIPCAIIVGSLAYAYSRNAPVVPLLISGAVALAVTIGATLWILHMIRSITVTLDANALTVASGIATQRFPIASLRSYGVQSVDLAEHDELAPSIRTYGIGMPGLASGWFRMRNGDKAFCVITDRRRVAELKSDDGTWILLSLVDTSALRNALGAR